MLYADSEVLRKVRKDVRDKKFVDDGTFPDNGIDRKTGISPAHALSTKGADLIYNGEALSKKDSKK